MGGWASGRGRGGWTSTSSSIFTGNAPLPSGYAVVEVSPGVHRVTGPDGFTQTWATRREAEDAARDHARDGTVVSPHDPE